MSPRAWVAHGIHFQGDEIERLGKAGVSVCHCAASDMAFGMGVCPTKELEAAGVAIGLGVDGSASNDSSNMMEAVRHSLLLAAPELRARGGDAVRCAPLGDAGIGALPGAGRHRRHRAGDAGRSRALHPRRAALLGRAGPDRRARALRRASGRQGDGRGRMAGHRRSPRGRRPPRPHRQAQGGGARLRLRRAPRPRTNRLGESRAEQTSINANRR